MTNNWLCGVSTRRFVRISNLVSGSVDRVDFTPEYGVVHPGDHLVGRGGEWGGVWSGDFPLLVPVEVGVSGHATCCLLCLLLGMHLSKLYLHVGEEGEKEGRRERKRGGRRERGEENRDKEKGVGFTVLSLPFYTYTKRGSVRVT